MNPKHITPNDLQPMDAPADGWYHIESNDDHPALYDGTRIVQVLDNDAMAAIAAAGVPEEGLPIDADHRGVPGIADVPDTAAAGWVRELALFDDGSGHWQLAARIEWTPPGLALVQGRVYKHFSTVYRIDDPALARPLGSDRFRPLVLLGLALTNNPNNRTGQRPITNSLPAHLPPATPAGETQTKHQTNMNELEEIKKALGLAPDAPLADTLAAIAAIKGEAAAAADSEAETLLNSEGLSDLPEEEKKELKEGLVTNRSLALMTIRAFKERRASANATPRYARPGTPRATSEQTRSYLINRAKEIQRRERAEGRTCSFWKALNLAKTETK